MRQAVVRRFFVLCAAALAVGCGTEAMTEPGPTGSVEQGLVDPFRSLAVTDLEILEPFTFERVMDQLVSTSGVPGANIHDLFWQWWDTQNMGPSLGMGPHCDDEITAGQPSLNGFPWECPRGEGYQIGVDPYSPPDNPLYIPIGLFNRFDLAPADGSHCGEYRIVFAMSPSSGDARGRNFVIFEAVLPNPRPDLGIQGCYPVAKMWYELTNIDDIAERRAILEHFYFHGWEDFPPVVHAEHYGTHLGADGYGCSTGQIRTNQFAGGEWNLREFRLVKDCRCNQCFLVMAPTTVKDNPWGQLFDPTSSHPLVPALQSTLLGAVGSLGNGGVNDLGWTVDNKLNPGESVAVGGGPDDYFNFFVGGTPSSPGFWASIDAQITALFGPGFYTPEEIVTRAQTQSCAGCHHTTNFANIGNGFTWPDSFDFVHVMEFPAGPAYPLSNALINEFLPHRAQLLENYIVSGGSAAPTNNRCRMPMPPELDVDCLSEASRRVDLRSFKASGLEALVPRSKVRSLGGARVH